MKDDGPPDVGEVARQVIGAMIAQPNSLPDGFGKATVKDENDVPIYVIAVILGPGNVERTAKALDVVEVLSHKATDVFTEDGQLQQPKKKKTKKRRGKKRSFRPSRRSPH